MMQSWPNRARTVGRLAAAGLGLVVGCLAAASLGLAVGCGTPFGSGDGSAGGGGTSATTTSPATTTGTTSTPVSAVGCSDGHRDGLDAATDLAACAGGFLEPGLSAPPSCSRLAGNDSSNTIGTGCHAADLCAPGWRVCASAEEVESRLGSVTSCESLTGGFFATQQPATAVGACVAGATGGIAGCGDLGEALIDPTCGPLTVVMLPATCDASPLWVCSAGSPLTSVYKRESAEGGVLCCR